MQDYTGIQFMEKRTIVNQFRVKKTNTNVFLKMSSTKTKWQVKAKRLKAKP